MFPPYIYRTKENYDFEVRCQYKETWNNLNAKRGYPWESNPWVEVITFEQISREEAEGSEEK